MAPSQRFPVVPFTWVITRLVVLLFLVGPESRVVGDVVYFSHALRHFPVAGFAGTIREYPLPALAVVAVPWLVAKALGDVHLYAPAFVAAALATDAVFTYLLARCAPRRRTLALTVWLVSVPAMGAGSATCGSTCCRVCWWGSRSCWRPPAHGWPPRASRWPPQSSSGRLC